MPECLLDPLAPHGFDRSSSHSLGRYVCLCESIAKEDWMEYHRDNNWESLDLDLFHTEPVFSSDGQGWYQQIATRPLLDSKGEPILLKYCICANTKLIECRCDCNSWDKNYE